MSIISSPNLARAFVRSMRNISGQAILLTATVLSTTTNLPAAQLPPQGSSRVYIQVDGNQKDLVLNNIQRGGGVVHYEFDSLNALAATLPDQAIEALRKSSSVLKIEPDPARYLLSSEITPGLAAIETEAAWASPGSGLTPLSGNGVKVGVIDSGIFEDHVDLDASRITGEPTQILQRVNAKGKPQYETVNLGPDDEAYWARDRDGHGTHVSGTIAAILNNDGVAGVAPNASIHMIKVFGDDGTWIYSSSLLNAAQQAANAGVSAINMSLGGSVPSSTEEAGMAQLEAGGVVLIAAAGNDGNGTYSYPASYDSVISVAAIDTSTGVVANFSQFNDQVEIAAPGVSVLSTVPFANEGSVTFEGTKYTGNPVEFSADSAGGGDTGALVNGGFGDTVGSWSGKVVLVERGAVSFYDKVRNVEHGGGIAAIIYNNEPGNFLGTLGDGNSSTIPAISISQEDGVVLRGLIDGQKAATVVKDTSINSSSYAAWDGTSMATPHVTGAVALLLEAYPNATPAQVRKALADSAQDLGAPGRDVYYGHGLLQINQALVALAAILSGDGGGGDPPADTLSIVNGSVDAQTVNARRGTFRITWTTNQAADGTVTFSNGGVFNQAEYTTSHRFDFRGRSGDTYTYSVRSSNANGTDTAGPFVFTIN